MATPLSILDLAFVAPAQSTRDALLESVALAQKAEETGRFERIWFAEHHNMRTIASAATSVLIGHVASATSTIRVGAGGIMLPNHSPLVIAEQFGTLAELHPGRIDLGLGRAPGTDQQTLRALRRDPRASDQFPQDVQELQGYLSQDSLIPGIHAYPGWGTQVPLYILGSSLFGAQLAAALGLPYSFASHFAPDALEQAVQVYRERFQPSEQLAEPYVIAALNVIAADDTAAAEEQARLVRRQRLRTMAGRRGTELTEEQVDEAMGTAFGQQVQHMMRYTAVGDGAEVARYLAQFREHAQADELMVTNATQGLEDRKRALEIIATVP
ncbi:LLM class flavin-dependent oxidoreductase [Arsenicicoccus bolidensis]|uniref:LLM class flavin-dependent oxidoreductase n=1 Tax=Arsenicicoccus bolidensis TaxID=229480 RepID=A0ABS9Q2N7_9MICO|nr:LLM class flavin-dependent oxidoreductase [Arsenicicoccus bolidensis]MCG7322146.1 LLM class flavin-dependent oxidoreductase [Arsenicicoccus bolidensis]